MAKSFPRPAVLGSSVRRACVATLLLAAPGCGDTNAADGTGSAFGEQTPMEPGASGAMTTATTGAAMQPTAAEGTVPATGVAAPASAASGSAALASSGAAVAATGEQQATGQEQVAGQTQPSEAAAPGAATSAPMATQPAAEDAAVETPGAEVSTPEETTDPAPAPEGAAGTVACNFEVSAEISSAIATVGIVNWSTDLTGVTAAHIEFGLQGQPASLSAPVETTDGEHRTLLLGMKGSSTYAYTIVAEAGGQVCSSPEYTIETGPVANQVRVLDMDVRKPEAVTPGFIVLSDGIGNGGGSGLVYIIDQDGDPVWWAPAPPSTSRGRMDWEGNNMWMLSLNVQNSGSAAMRRVSMDGLDVEENVSGMSDVHHDFCVLPGGIIAGPSWTTAGNDPPSEILERAPDGTVTSVATVGTNIYNSNSFHANAIHYHPSDDAYSLSDRNPNLYVKISRQGQLIWQLGGSNPVGASFSGDTTWSVNHGHHYTEDGHFLVFNNNGRGGGGGLGGTSLMLEYILDEDAMTAELVWEYDGGVGSGTLGDVQRLPNGNTLVTYSNSGTIHELGPDKELVQVITGASSFGYAIHRPSLYGPPPKSR